MTEQETIEQAIIGKRIVAVSWRPVEVGGETSMSLEVIMLDGGIVLEFWAGGYPYIVEAEIKEGQYA